MFAVQAMVLLQFLRFATGLPRTKRYGAALALAVATGAAVELVQPSFGRAAEWGDLWTDTLGAAAGLALAAWREADVERRGRRRLWAVMFAALVVAIAWPVAEAALGYAMRAYRFPELFSVTTVPDRYFLRLRGAVGERRQLPEAWAQAGDSESLELRLIGGRWPGIALVEPEADWSGRERLVLDLTNPGAEPLELILRIHDRRHDHRREDRFNTRFELAGGRRSRIEFPLEQIAAGPQARRLDLSAVAGVILYAAQGPSAAGRVFYVTQVRLE